MLLGDPGRVSAGRSQGAPEAVAGGRGCHVAPDMAWVASVSIGRQVLVELVDVKGLHVGHHLVADLADVHVAEVDVGLSPFPQGAPFPLGVGFACLQLGLRGGGRRGGAVALTCKVKNILRRKERGEGELLLSTTGQLRSSQYASNCTETSVEGEPPNGQPRTNIFISSCQKQGRVK